MKYILVCMLAFTFACGGTISVKQRIDQYDRAAFTALRSFQTAEETAYHNKAAWPTDEQHKKIGATLSKAYSLVISVARAGRDLKAGQPTTPQLQKDIDNLIEIVADISAAAGASPDQKSLADVKTQISNLIATVKGT